MGDMMIRDACRQRMPLGGPDAQALEGALSQVEREAAALTQERDGLALDAEEDTSLISDLRERVADFERALARRKAERDIAHKHESDLHERWQAVLADLSALQQERDRLAARLAAAERERDAMKEAIGQQTESARRWQNKDATARRKLRKAQSRLSQAATMARGLYMQPSGDCALRGGEPCDCGCDAHNALVSALVAHCEAQRGAAGERDDG